MHQDYQLFFLYFSFLNHTIQIESSLEDFLNFQSFTNSFKLFFILYV